MTLLDRPATLLRTAFARPDVWARFWRLRRHLRHAGESPAPGFLVYVGRRFWTDNGPESAAGLSYSSLLAMVPLLAITLGMVSAFPAFAGVEERILDTILNDLLPPVSETGSERIRAFIHNAKALTGPGIIGLAVTAILLLSNVNGAFNTIWRVSEPRPLAMRFLVYWALLTLGPLLLAASMSASSPIFAALSGDGVTGVVRWLMPPWLLSVVVGTIGFGVLFLVVPNRPIRIPHALVGGLVTAAMFEVLKVAFALYLAVVPGYTAVYGAVAVIPIFLIWLYLSWAVVLIGAEVTASLPEWTAYRARAGTLWTGERLTLALALLDRLRSAQTRGEALWRSALVRGLPATPGEVDGVLAPLRRTGIIARTSGSRWVLASDLRKVTLDRLMRVLDLSLAPGQGWPAPAHGAVGELADATAAWTRRDLESLLAGEAATGGDPRADGADAAATAPDRAPA
jgi:membrane protein